MGFFYFMNPEILRKRFFKHVLKKWELIDRWTENNKCVYVIIGLGYLGQLDNADILYVGSTTCLKSRYKAHKIPNKIYEAGMIPSLFFIKMEKGFYDYEMKLIKKLNPIFNKQHKIKYNA